MRTHRGVVASICMRVGALLLMLTVAGCASHGNPSFPITSANAKVAWSVMREHPKPLERPVVILGGIYDPGIAAARVKFDLREIVDDADEDRIINIGFLDTGTFDRAAKKTIDAVDERFPPADPTQTIEVDVIGFSMGGLVARYAASDAYEARFGRRLNIRRLFTVSSPHQGAKLAWIPLPDSRVIDMRAGSPFLANLNAEACTYEIVCYARLGDEVVGEQNAAPPGQTAWWVPKDLGLSHLSAYSDKRILGDIARRLREEEPFAVGSPAPLP